MRGAEVWVNGTLQNIRTPATFRLEKGRTYTVEVSAPAEAGKFYEKASGTIQAERPGLQTWTATIRELAFRCGRPLKSDPVTEHIVGDEEADRLVNQPMRAPWRI